MTHLRECPDERNKGKRDVVSVPLRPIMFETLKTMHEKTTGETAGLPFETYLGQILENAAAEFRSQQWRAAHPAKPERETERTGMAYTAAALQIVEEKRRADIAELQKAAE
jgi:hypothetical protein